MKTNTKEEGIAMEKEQFNREHSLVQGAQKSRFLPFWWLAPFICYVLVELGGELGNILFDPVFNMDIGIQDWANISDLLSVSVTAIVFFVWVRLIEGRSIRTMGFPRQDALSEYMIGCLVGTGMIALVVGIMTLFGFVTFSRFSLDASTFLAFLLAGVGYTIQGSTEEIYTRGWLLPMMASKTHKWIAIVLSSSFFSLIHLNNIGVNYMSSMNTVLFALFLAIYAWKKGDIWGVCGIHVAWNFVQGHIFGLNVSGFPSESSLAYLETRGAEWLSGGTYGVEASIVSTIVYLAMIIYVLFMMKSKAPKQTAQYKSLQKSL